MTFARTGELIDAAVAAGRSVLALNVITLEHAEGILLGAARVERPVVLQVSENAIGYHDGVGEPLLRACAALIDIARRDCVAAPRPHHRRPRCSTSRWTSSASAR